MADWEGKTRGGITGYKIFVFFIRTLGISFAYFFLHIVAVYYVIFHRKAYREIHYYFRRILKYGSLRSFVAVYRNFCMLGKILVDKVAILSGLRNKYTFDFDGEEYLRQMATEGTGGILVDAHVGNWEIAGQLLERLDTVIHLLMFQAEQEKISGYLAKVLTEKNMRIIPIREDMSHLSEIKEALQKKEIIAIMGDRFMEGNKVYNLEFLGSKAFFPAGPFAIAARFNVPLTFVFAMKEKKTHYHFYATPLQRVGKYRSIAERERVTIAMMEEYVRELEKKVKMYPLQWFNYYQFWNNAT
jgi:predicted LPLAT superfamily acyltransferase